METIKTRIYKIYNMGDYTRYVFNYECKCNYILDVVAYSEESNFIANNFGANNELKLEKEVYLTLDYKNEILSISNLEGNTKVIKLIMLDNSRVSTKNDEYIMKAFGLTIGEYEEAIKAKIKGNSLRKVMK